jgi:methylase of polypeptide subunit release factors
VSTAWCEFGPLRVAYDDRVLAPRPWTLLQSCRAAERLVGAPPGRVVELHCGAGHIGQAAAAWSGRALVQVDDDPVCCAWATHNATTNQVAATVVCGQVDALPLRPASAALVLADPPYVPSTDVARFPEDPTHAIDGGVDGLDGVRACLPVMRTLLVDGGVALLQMRGPEQADAIAALASAIDASWDVVDVVAPAPDRAVVELVLDR